MSKEKVAATSVKMVPFDQIEVDELDNARQSGVSPAKIRAIADSIARERRSVDRRPPTSRLASSR